MIKCENASVTYGNYVACENVSFSVNPGEYLCIVGANGSGKTTIVKATLGLLPLAKGKITKENCEIGYLPQQSSIQRDFPATVREVVLSGCIKKNLFYSKEDKKLAEKQIEKLVEDTVFVSNLRCLQSELCYSYVCLAREFSLWK